MLKISKGAEPKCLTTARAKYQATHGAVSNDAWKSALDGACKQTMREVAWTEQGGLCAYCMSPFSGTHPADSKHPEKGGMKLEHFEARNTAGHRTLDWENLLGVCSGIVIGRSVDNSGTDEAGIAHCDTYRGNLDPVDQDLSYSPVKAPPDVSVLYRYGLTQGEVLSDDKAAEQDIVRLNLNLARLKRNRLAVLDEIRKRLQADDSLAVLKKLHQDYARKDSGGRLRPYAGVGLWYVERKLRQRGT